MWGIPGTDPAILPHASYVRISVAPVDGLVSPAYVVLDPRSDVSSEYYAHLFRTNAGKGEFSRAARGIVSDRDRLYWESFKQIGFPFPPPKEQLAIVDSLLRSTARIDTASARHQHEIELIQEYRTRLISDVVTGKLDVRIASGHRGD